MNNEMRFVKLPVAQYNSITDKYTLLNYQIFPVHRIVRCVENFRHFVCELFVADEENNPQKYVILYNGAELTGLLNQVCEGQR